MGNGLYRLLTAARLSGTSDSPLWEELWQFWKEKYFTFDLTQYENLGLGGGGHMFSLPQMIAMMLIGVIIAAFATIFNKRVLGDFVRVMLQYEATSVEKAKTLVTALSAIHNAGSIFVGPYTPVACGDYASGTNHVLPTAGYAKSYSALDVGHFMKRSQVQMVSREGLEVIGDTIETLAQAEGLFAHANSVKLRRK